MTTFCTLLPLKIIHLLTALLLLVLKTLLILTVLQTLARLKDLAPVSLMISHLSHVSVRFKLHCVPMLLLSLLHV